MESEIYSPLEMELRKLDLNEKEARVYLASLELGHASVQKISKKAGLSRPTAYRALESLQQKGMVRKIKQNFIADSPDEILGMLRAEKRKIEEQEREYLRIISLLKSKYYLSGKNEIKTLSENEGEKFLLEDLPLTHAKEIVLIFPEGREINNAIIKSSLEARKRSGKVKIKIISGYKIERAFPEFVEKKITDKFPNNFPELAVLYDKAAFKKNSQWIVVAEENTVELLKSFSALF